MYLLAVRSLHLEELLVHKLFVNLAFAKLQVVFQSRLACNDVEVGSRREVALVETCRSHSTTFVVTVDRVNLGTDCKFNIGNAKIGTVGVGL